MEISPNSEFVAISWPRKPYIEIRKVDDQNWVARIEDNETIQWAPDSLQLLVIGEFNVFIMIPLLVEIEYLQFEQQEYYLYEEP